MLKSLFSFGHVPSFPVLRRMQLDVLAPLSIFALAPTTQGTRCKTYSYSRSVIFPFTGCSVHFVSKMHSKDGAAVPDSLQPLLTSFSPGCQHFAQAHLANLPHHTSLRSLPAATTSCPSNNSQCYPRLPGSSIGVCIARNP